MGPDLEPRLTILIPLHRGDKWVSNVSTILERSPLNCRIVISDITLCDDALNQLKKTHHHDSRIHFRSRSSELGWRRHINELFDLVETEFCSIMPQDDLILPGYYETLIATLDDHPEVGLAFGQIIPVEIPGHVGCPVSFSPAPKINQSPWKEALFLDQHWNLGIPWRGLVRSEYLWPTPLIPHGFADQMWVFGIALTTHLLEVPEAVYQKRYHSENTHSSWAPLIGRDRYEVLAEIIESRLAHDSKAKRDAMRELGKRADFRAFRKPLIQRFLELMSSR